MKMTRIALVFAAGIVAGCMTAGPPAPAQAPPPATGSRVAAGVPLVLDRADFRLGSTVQFARIPAANELYELHNTTGLAHVLLALPAWPRSYADLEPLQQTPEQADLIVVLPGYPPTREAADAWNLLNVRTRLILVVDGPPVSSHAIADLNAMRALERLIVNTEEPSRSGFERVQRPISFRVVRD
ncbi:MAG TPA: hypothetical protein VFQ05_03420 [Candidatus Eisenbacteria bacterium]|nr:hypothetical protein [Candidatus Eisenbacteria bacterium]